MACTYTVEQMRERTGEWRPQASGPSAREARLAFARSMEPDLAQAPDAFVLKWHWPQMRRAFRLRVRKTCRTTR